MAGYRHPTSLIASTNIGDGTRIEAFVNICEGAVIGTDCNICDHVFIENEVIVGNRVTIKCGVFLWNGVTIEDDVFIGPGVGFTNDLYPRSIVHSETRVPTLVRKGASIGANATILAGVTIGMNAIVGAGSVVTADVPPNAIVRGNPARIGRNLESGAGRRKIAPPSPAGESRLLSVPAVRLFQMPSIKDLRGTLSFGEIGAHLPFAPKRYFLIYDVPSKDIRGEHAHRKLEQLLMCVAGDCRVVVDDGRSRDEVTLNRPDLGIYIPPMVWGIQYKYSHDAVLLVLASEEYDPEGYIRDYDEFLRLTSSTNGH